MAGLTSHLEGVGDDPRDSSILRSPIAQEDKGQKNALLRQVKPGEESL